MGLYEVEETCRLHSESCPDDQSVIIPGTTWHDVVCGHPEQCKVSEHLDYVQQSTPVLDALKELTASWVRAIPNSEVERLCKEMTSYKQLTWCMHNFEKMLQDMLSPAESLYYRLNKLSFYHTSKLMYDAVVKPFLGGNAEPSIQLLHPNPWWVGEAEKLIIQTRLAIPIGMSHRYIPNTLNWYTGKLWGKWVVRADNTGVVFSESRYNITRGFDWTKWDSNGFFVYMFDISLVVGNCASRCEAMQCSTSGV